MPKYYPDYDDYDYYEDDEDETSNLTNSIAVRYGYESPYDNIPPRVDDFVDLTGFDDDYED